MPCLTHCLAVGCPQLMSFDPEKADCWDHCCPYSYKARIVKEGILVRGQQQDQGMSREGRDTGKG